MPNPVTEFEILSGDPDASAAFFADLFGGKMEKYPGHVYNVVDTGSETGIQGGIASSGGYPTRALFHITVDDIHAYADKVPAAGGTVLVPPMSEGDAPLVALFSDPAGAAVGMTQAQS